MRLRIFRARSTAQALAEVRRELGEEAVILGVTRRGGGVEVTAAVEPQEEAPLPSRAAPEPRSLAWHNTPPTLLERLRTGHLVEALRRELCFAPLPAGQERPVLLAGPPGAGKTTTAGKFATRALLSGAPPLLVTSDSNRAGAAEQLAAFARILGTGMAMAATTEALLKALRGRRPGQPVVIDTAGTDPFDAEEMARLSAFARAVDAEMVLVLPAGLDPAEAAEIARIYAVAGCRLLLPTRLDQARRLGSVLAAAWGGPLALTEGGIGPGPAGGLLPLTPETLAGRLRGDPIAAEETAA
jgi:flagellar biosynthesis protein FlhF